jgi:hypothetical protein
MSCRKQLTSLGGMIRPGFHQVLRELSILQLMPALGPKPSMTTKRSDFRFTLGS